MVDQDDGEAPQARPPGVEDLIALCRRLNQEGARYIVIGGVAVIQVGFVRATEDELDRAFPRSLLEREGDV